MAHAFDPEWLSVLVCPLTRTALRHDKTAGELISDAAGLAYPIRDGRAILLVDAARVIDAGEAVGPETG